MSETHSAKGRVLFAQESFLANDAELTFLQPHVIGMRNLCTCVGDADSGRVHSDRHVALGSW